MCLLCQMCVTTALMNWLKAVNHRSGFPCQTIFLTETPTEITLYDLILKKRPPSPFRNILVRVCVCVCVCVCECVLVHAHGRVFLAASGLFRQVYTCTPVVTRGLDWLEKNSRKSLAAFRLCGFACRGNQLRTPLGRTFLSALSVFIW